jgi:hypothetical protein
MLTLRPEHQFVTCQLDRVEHLLHPKFRKKLQFVTYQLDRAEHLLHRKHRQQMIRSL